jgi:Fe2+ or Zn2+ uptake regulation protein
LKNLEECVKKRFLSTSRAREVIYAILKNEQHNCLNMEDIRKKAKEIYPKNISTNSLYRHLNFFVECDLVCIIQADSKKAYYCFKKHDELPMFEICSTCKSISKSKLKNIINYQDEINQIILYKKCFTCKSK